METAIAPLDTIRCPNCRHVIPISEMLSHQIAERARAQSKAEIEELRTALAREQREIKEREKKVEVLVEKRVATRVAKIEQDEREKARGSVSLEIKDLNNQLAEVLKQRDAAQKGELEARRRARELDQRAKNLDLEAARKIDAERQKIQNEASKRAEERYQLKLAEKEKQIQDAKKANDELKRKLEQGSQQAQGEVLEIQLEELLQGAFPLDQIEAVPKGMNGADIVQKVFTRSGQYCGTIVWECRERRRRPTMVIGFWLRRPPRGAVTHAKKENSENELRRAGLASSAHRSRRRRQAARCRVSIAQGSPYPR
jgi:hypothetical protein